jgi:hypothetical protein
MHIHGREIRLDPGQTSVDAREDDWSIGRDSKFITHIPSQVTFQIDLDEGMEAAKRISVFNYSATPIYISRGQSLPDSEDLTELGRCAIILYLQTMGELEAVRRGKALHRGEPDLTVN